MKTKNLFRSLLLMSAVITFSPVLGQSHDYVDLGLPSGTKWATCNVGATNPEDYGNHYAWGEKRTKSDYSVSSYRYFYDGDDNKITKYSKSHGKDGFADNKLVLDLSDDVARANWGGNWRIPTAAEWEELIQKCSWKWTTINGISGCKVTGANGNFIFLPAAGYRALYGLENKWDGCYWSSSRSSNSDYSAVSLLFERVNYYDNLNVEMTTDLRKWGLSVRPVCK